MRYVELLHEHKVYNPNLVKNGLIQFSKGFEGGKKIRAQVSGLKTEEEIMQFLEKMVKAD